jgi:RNA polymerase sigma-70 factor (ECF subfamily)
LSRIYGKQAAILEAEKLGLAKNHLYHVLLGWLYTGIDKEKAKEHLNLALVYAKTETERIGIRKELAKV